MDFEINEIRVETTSDIARIKVYSLAGSEIPVSSQMLGNSAIVDVTPLPSGLYILRTYATLGKVDYYKFLIAK